MGGIKSKDEDAAQKAQKARQHREEETARRQAEAEDARTGITDPATWAAKHYRVHKDEPWLPVRYLADFMGVAAHKKGPRTVVLWKASQLGFSHGMTALHAHHVGELDKRCYVAMPTDDDAASYFRRFLKGPHETIPRLKALAVAQPDNRVARGQHRVFHSGGESAVQGAGVGNRYASFVADLLVLDELDRYPVIKEGDALTLSKRATRNTGGVLCAGSTPTTAYGRSQIAHAYREADIQFVFQVLCPVCQSYDAIEWERVKFVGAGSRQKRADSADHKCSRCGKHWQHWQLEDAIAQGRWVEASIDDGEDWPVPVPNPLYVADDGALRGPRGGRRRWPRTAGFAIWAGYSIWYSWSEIVYELLSAKNDAEKLRAFNEQTLARPFSDTETEVHPHQIRDNAVPHAKNAPLDHSLSVISVDVQNGWLSVMTSLWGANEKCVIVDRREFEGDTHHLEGSAWERFEEWLNAPDDPETDNPIVEGCHPALLAVDVGYQMDVTLQNLRALRFAGSWYAVRGVSGWQRSSYHRGRGKSRGTKRLVYELGVDNLKSTVVTDLARGNMRVVADLVEPLKDELTSESLEEQRTMGRKRKYWKKHGKRRNEGLDQLVYALGAVRISGISVFHDRNPEGVRVVRRRRGLRERGTIGL